jgi:hypothetical protein
LRTLEGAPTRTPAVCPQRSFAAGCQTAGERQADNRGSHTGTAVAAYVNTALRVKAARYGIPNRGPKQRVTQSETKPPTGVMAPSVMQRMVVYFRTRVRAQMQCPAKRVINQ